MNAGRTIGVPFCSQHSKLSHIAAQYQLLYTQLMTQNWDISMPLIMLICLYTLEFSLAKNFNDQWVSAYHFLCTENNTFVVPTTSKIWQKCNITLYQRTNFSEFHPI